MVGLIPVIELPIADVDLNIPENSVFWEQPGVWSEYYENKIRVLGFSEKIKTYRPGMPWVEIEAISKKDLSVLVESYVRNAEWEYLTPFPGGYLLTVNDKEVLYPQCCGNLEDINYWEAILEGVEHHPYMNAHPEPMVHYNEGNITLDFNEWEEPFYPPCPVMKLEIEKDELIQAVSRAKVVLEDFASKLISVNNRNNYGIENIDQALIWG